MKTRPTRPPCWVSWLGWCSVGERQKYWCGKFYAMGADLATNVAGNESREARMEFITIPTVNPKGRGQGCGRRQRLAPVVIRGDGPWTPGSKPAPRRDGRSLVTFMPRQGVHATTSGPAPGSSIPTRGRCRKGITKRRGFAFTPSLARGAYSLAPEEGPCYRKVAPACARHPAGSRERLGRPSASRRAVSCSPDIPPNACWHQAGRPPSSSGRLPSACTA